MQALPILLIIIWIRFKGVDLLDAFTVFPQGARSLEIVTACVDKDFFLTETHEAWAKILLCLARALKHTPFED